MEDAFPRCVDDPLCAVAADDAGDAGVRDGDALPDDASQTMAALGLHHEINVLPRSESRAEGNGQRGHIPRRAEISLRKDGVHDNGGPHLRDQRSLRVHHHRHIAAAPDDHGLVQRLHEGGTHPFYDRLALIDGLAYRDLTADGGGLFRFQHEHLQPRRPQPVDGAGGKVAAAPHKDDFITLHRSFPP